VNGHQPSRRIGNIDGEQRQHQGHLVPDGVVATNGDRDQGTHGVRDRLLSSPQEKSTERARDGRECHVVHRDLEDAADVVHVVERSVCRLVAPVGADGAGERRPRRRDERRGERGQARDDIRDRVYRTGR